MSGVSGNNTPLRRPGLFEQYNITRHALKYYNTVGATAVYLLPASLLAQFVSIEALVYHVLRRVIQRHPALSLCVDDETCSNPQWIRPAKIDLKDVVNFRSGGVPLGQVIEDAHNVWLDRLHELPAWRVVVSSAGSGKSGRPSGSQKENVGKMVEVNIGFFFHHAVGDGTSGAAFHLSFLEVLNALTTQNVVAPACDSLVVPSDLDLLPPLEAYNLPLGYLYIANNVFAGILPGGSDDQLWTGPPVQGVVVEPPHTQLLLLTLPDSTSSALTQLCRTNRTTITPLLTYLIARILSSIYPVYSDFKAVIPYTLRRHTGTSPTEITLQISGIDVRFSSSSNASRKGCASCAAREDIDWNSVRQCKREFDAAASAPGNHIVSLLKYAGDLKTWFRKKLGGKRPGSFEVSNLGRVDGALERSGGAEMGPEPQACFRTVVFSQPANVLNHPYTFSVATVKGGEMAICLNWQEGIVEEETAKAVMGVLEMELKGLADPDEEDEEEDGN